MKRKVALLMAAVMTAGLWACSSEEPAQETGQSSSQAQTSQAAQTDAAAETGNGTEAAESQAEGEWNFEGVTLNLAHATTGEVGDAFLAQFEAFEELTGATIEVEMLSADPDEQVSTLSVRAATGNLPDIWQNSIGAMMETIDPQANVYDLSGQDWIRENVTDTYLEIVADDETGALYGVPCTTSNVAGCFYNKTVYEELGLEIPTTWEEFLANCEIISSQTDKVPVATPYSDGAGAQILFLAQYYYVNQEDPEFADKYTNREIELHESPAYMRGLEKMNDLYVNGYQSADPLALSFADAALQVAHGDAVMTFSRTNIMATAAGGVPDSLDEFGFFPLPDESSEVLGVATWMPPAWCMNANIDPEKEACALAFMEFMTTSEAIDAYCTKTVPTGAFMLNGIELPDNITSAVREAQEWVERASTPVMEYQCSIKGANLVTILQMVGTGEYTPDEAITEIEMDNAIDAQQKGIAGW